MDKDGGRLVVRGDDEGEEGLHGNRDRWLTAGSNHVVIDTLLHRLGMATEAGRPLMRRTCSMRRSTCSLCCT